MLRVWDDGVLVYDQSGGMWDHSGDIWDHSVACVIRMGLVSECG